MNNGTKIKRSSESNFCQNKLIMFPTQAWFFLYSVLLGIKKGTINYLPAKLMVKYVKIISFFLHPSVFLGLRYYNYLAISLLKMLQWFPEPFCMKSKILDLAYNSVYDVDKKARPCKKHWRHVMMSPSANHMPRMCLGLCAITWSQSSHEKKAWFHLFHQRNRC